MEHAQIKTVTSREFVHNVSAAKRAAIEGGPVIITDRGEPSLVLIPIADHRCLTKTARSLVNLLRMPETDDLAFDFDAIQIRAREIDA